MDKEPQAADSQQETSPVKKPKKPWPMRWVILCTVLYLAIYTYWRLK
jgi:hypothetical protein